MLLVEYLITSLKGHEGRLDLEDVQSRERVLKAKGSTQCGFASNTEGEEDVDLEEGSSIGETTLEDVEGPPFS